MSLQPIDLQTLFLKLSQVGQDQAAEKNALIQGQEVAGREIALRSQQHQRSVGETQRLQEGPEAANERESGEQGESGERSQEEAEAKGTEEQDVFRDPDLGQNIDISG